MNETTVHQLFDLSGRSALVTGGCGHLGSAMCRALAEAGATVVAASRDQGRADEFAASLPSPGGAAHGGVALNHLEEESLNAGFDNAVQMTGGIDILVNNGQQGHALDWTDVTKEAFDADLKNVSGYFLLARRFREHIVKRQVSGSIVMIGSMYGVVGSYPEAYEDVCTASPVQYHALKGGVVHMTRHLAVYWAKDNVRVNCLSPGPFPGARAPGEMVKRLRGKSPMGRMGLAHELKAPLLLLVSDGGSYITGQNLLVDGGWTAW